MFYFLWIVHTSQLNPRSKCARVSSGCGAIHPSTLVWWELPRFGATVLLKVQKMHLKHYLVMSLSTTHVVICFYATHSPPKVGVWPANMRAVTISADVLSRCPTTSISSQINACSLWHGGAVGRCSFIRRRNCSQQDFWKQMLLLSLFQYIFS